MGTIPDEQLLQDFAHRGSEEAFSELVRRHVQLVYGSAMRQLRNPEMAQEVTQAVFLILSQKAGRLGGSVVLAGWLYQTTLYAVANARRSEVRRKKLEQSMAQLHDDAGEMPGSQDAWFERVEPLVDEAMGHLGEADRTALILHYLEDKPLREVGSLLGSSEDAAQKRVSRALDKLRLHLKRKGVVVSAVGLAGALQVCGAQAAPASLVSSIALAATSAATVPTSTLAFTKQTLTLMAWTKTKTAILTTAAMLLLSGGVATSLWWAKSSSTLPAGALGGAWQGTLRLQNQAELRLVARFQPQPDGTYKATLDSVDQGVGNLPIPVVEVRGRSLKFSMPALNATYEAKVNADGTELDGQWSQLNFKNSMRFTKTDKPFTVSSIASEVALERRRDFDVQGRWEGTLRVPGASLRLLLKMQEKESGTFAGTLDSIDQGVRDMPFSSVRASGSNVVIEIASIDGRYEGAIDRAASEIEGEWTQAGKKFPLDFKRAKPESKQVAASDKNAPGGEPHKVSGSWKGVLQVKDVKLRLRLKISGNQDGKLSVLMDSLDQGGRDIPSTVANYEEDQLRVEWRGIAAVYTAHLDGEDLIGEWKQGPAVFPLTMQRENEK